MTTDAEMMRPSGINPDGSLTPRLAGLLCLLTFVVTVFVLVGYYQGYLRDQIFMQGQRAASKAAKKE
jgi:hypothetical protein